MFTGVKPLEGQQPEGGSTDVADVSWVVPTLHLSVATSPLARAVACVAGRGQRRHVDRPQGHAAGRQDAGRDDGGSVRATRRRSRPCRRSSRRRKGDTVYRPYVPDGPPPLPKH